MKVMPTSRDDLVIPKVAAAGWLWLKHLNVRLSLSTLLLSAHAWCAYLAIKEGSYWAAVYAAMDSYESPWAVGGTMHYVLLLLSSGFLAIAGLSAYALANANGASSDRSNILRSRKILSIHCLIFAAAVISIIGVRYYTDELLSVYWRQALPFSTALAVLTLIGLVLLWSLRLKYNWTKALTLQMPLIHQACLLLMFAFFYYSIIGNIVDVIK